MKTSPIFCGISDIQRLLGENKLNEVVDYFEKQIETYNPYINSIVFQNPDLQKDIDFLENIDPKAKQSMKLFGVPVTVKDVWETTNMPTVSGHKPLKDYYAEKDATIVTRIKDAGAVILGKTNLPELAVDLQSNNDVYGRTNNPWNLNKTVGGSSGGCASAIASGMSTLSFGSDIGGSLRIPAHYNGIFSIKASEHLIPGTGHIPDLPGQIKSARHMNSFGVMGRSIDDIITTLPILAGPDNIDQDVSPVNMQPVSIDRSKIKIAWYDQLPEAPIESAMENLFHQKMEKLAIDGIATEKYLPETFDAYELWNIWGTLMFHMVGINIPNLLLPVARTIIRFAGKHSPLTNPFKHRISIKKYFQTLDERDIHISYFNDFLSEFDALILPVSCTTAFDHMKPTMKIGALPVYREPIYVNSDPIQYFMATEAYVTPFNVLGSPVVIIPVGVTPSGLPMGIQVIGKKFEDMKLLAISKLLAESISDLQHPEMSFADHN